MPNNSSRVRQTYPTSRRSAFCRLVPHHQPAYAGVGCGRACQPNIRWAGPSEAPPRASVHAAMGHVLEPSSGGLPPLVEIVNRLRAEFVLVRIDEAEGLRL